MRVCSFCHKKFEDSEADAARAHIGAHLAEREATRAQTKEALDKKFAARAAQSPALHDGRPMIVETYPPSVYFAVQRLEDDLRSATATVESFSGAGGDFGGAGASGEY